MLIDCLLPFQFAFAETDKKNCIEAVLKEHMKRMVAEFCCPCWIKPPQSRHPLTVCGGWREWYRGCASTAALQKRLEHCTGDAMSADLCKALLIWHCFMAWGELGEWRRCLWEGVPEGSGGFEARGMLLERSDKF